MGKDQYYYKQDTWAKKMQWCNKKWMVRNVNKKKQAMSYD
jgi:hypothetical protein